MGKQVGFFMTFADEMAFLSALRDEFGAISVVANSSKTERKIITQLAPVNSFNANLSLMRAEDVDDIVSTYIAEQNLFCVDLLNSKIVQFNRSKPMNGWLAPGRLWFDEKCDNGKKSADFLYWANSLICWIKKHYNRTSDGLRFIGPEAEKQCAEGLLKLGPPIAGTTPEEI